MMVYVTEARLSYTSILDFHLVMSRWESRYRYPIKLILFSFVLLDRLFRNKMFSFIEIYFKKIL